MGSGDAVDFVYDRLTDEDKTAVMILTDQPVQILCDQIIFKTTALTDHRLNVMGNSIID